jgi:hypothetical protein
MDSGATVPAREERLITAAMRVPLSSVSGGTQAVHRLLERLERRVETVMPFLGEHVLMRHTPWLHRGGLDGEGDEEIDQRELQPAYGEAIPQTLGTSPVATQTGYKNLLLGSDAAFCGLGSDGPYVAALQMYSAITAEVRVRSGF